MNTREYFRWLQQALAEKTFILDIDLRLSEIDIDQCYVRGTLTLSNGYQLHVAEYVITAPVIVRTKYRYHLQTADALMVARWDNSPHHKEIDTFPNHCHRSDGSIQPSPPMDILSALAATFDILD